MGSEGVTLTASTAYAGVKHYDVLLSDIGIGPIFVGFVTAAFAAAAAVRWMVGWLQSRGMVVFAVWRIALAIVVAALLLTGRLEG